MREFEGKYKCGYVDDYLDGAHAPLGTDSVTLVNIFVTQFATVST
jgi:hypothetical protein